MLVKLQKFAALVLGLPLLNQILVRRPGIRRRTKRNKEQSMKKPASCYAAAIPLFVALGAHAETAKQYADQCKNELGFAASDVPKLISNAPPP